MSVNMKDKKQVTLYLDKTMCAELERYAKKIKISRHRLIENSLEGALEDLAVLEKIGVIFVGVGIRDLIRKLRNKQETQPELF